MNEIQEFKIRTTITAVDWTMKMKSNMVLCPGGTIGFFLWFFNATRDILCCRICWDSKANANFACRSFSCLVRFG